ncbi:hypothetical protein [Microvirga massiliensis]|uniref:hypothetical protein n=1 Tax=Microvirga massiliensis TaxID=1033741 RepID=UPI00062B36CD|nr:hypothetical protein [Microvirga massiliensis]
MRPKRQTLAQAGRGDPNVLAHPSYRAIPDCLFPLFTEAARKEYDTLARLLYDAGHLTADKHRSLSSYVAQFDNVHRAVADGKQIRASTFVQMDKARAALGLDDLDKPIAAPESAPINKFARAGFACRRR